MSSGYTTPATRKRSRRSRRRRAAVAMRCAALPPIRQHGAVEVWRGCSAVCPRSACAVSRRKAVQTEKRASNDPATVRRWCISARSAARWTRRARSCGGWRRWSSACAAPSTCCRRCRATHTPCSPPRFTGPPAIFAVTLQSQMLPLGQTLIGLPALFLLTPIRRTQRLCGSSLPSLRAALAA